MRITRTVLPVVLILFAASLTFGKIRIDYDHGTNFSKYRTFMWLEDPNTDNPFMVSRIVNAVNGQMRARGLQRVTEGADLGIKVSSSVEEIQTLNTYYNGGGWGWGWGGGWGYGGPTWATTYVETSLEGTTVVDLVDTETDQVVWRGVSKGSLSDKPEKASKKTTKRIGEMFEEYPPGRDDD